MSKSIITIFGPTASGKTSLAIYLAQKLNGVIVNADSRQVYKNMPIITAMPSKEEFAAADHRLFDFLEIDEKISVEKYVQLAKAEVEKIWRDGKLPILCGGTGFYLKTLEEGISPVPSLPEDLFNDLNTRLETEGLAPLYDELKNVDLEIADKLKAGDTQRILRALGVWLHTGQPMSKLQKLPKSGGLDARFVKLAISPEREWLYNRIHKRYDVMENMGLVDEVKNVRAMGYTTESHAVQSCGVKDYYNFLDGHITLDEAKTALLQSTRNYAKRQFTWIRGQYNADLTFTTSAQGEKSVMEIRQLLKNK
tara:strand:+ start:59616 stop:60542 length:927 start_codon:yes stop_codon:yes gene_type:complete